MFFRKKFPLLTWDFRYMDYQNYTKETVVSQCMISGLPPAQLSKHDCEVLVANTKLHTQVNGIGTVLLKKGWCGISLDKLQCSFKRVLHKCGM